MKLHSWHTKENNILALQAAIAAAHEATLQAALGQNTKDWVLCDGGAIDNQTLDRLMEIIFPPPEHSDMVTTYDRRDEE
jgi:hypothetical protein